MIKSFIINFFDYFAGRCKCFTFPKPSSVSLHFQSLHVTNEIKLGVIGILRAVIFLIPQDICCFDADASWIKNLLFTEQVF